MKESLLEREGIEIIDSPSLRSLFKTGVDWSLTTVFWGFLLYLFLPLFNLILYYLLGYTFYEKVILQAGYKHFFALLGSIGLATLVVITVITLWGVYNYRVFGRRNRRKFAPKVDADKLANFFGLSKEDMFNFQKKKFLEVRVENPHKIGSYIVSPL